MAYLLFFSVQICFRYSSTQSVDLDQYSSLSLQKQHAHGLNLLVHPNPQRPGKHILNKRYQPVDTMPVPETACVPERPVHCIKHVYRVVNERPVQSDHTATLLRGPPAAMA